MAKKKIKEETKEKGEQLELIDVHPENAKEIVKAAKLYKKYLAERQAVQVEEVAQKRKVLELVRAANMQPGEGGKIKFALDGYTICITPRDELVQVKEKDTEPDE